MGIKKVRKLGVCQQAEYIYMYKLIPIDLKDIKSCDWRRPVRCLQNIPYGEIAWLVQSVVCTSLGWG